MLSSGYGKVNCKVNTNIFLKLFLSHILLEISSNIFALGHTASRTERRYNVRLIVRRLGDRIRQQAGCLLQRLYVHCILIARCAIWSIPPCTDTGDGRDPTSTREVRAVARVTMQHWEGFAGAVHMEFQRLSVHCSGFRCQTAVSWGTNVGGQENLQFSDRHLQVSDRGNYGCLKLQFCP